MATEREKEIIAESVNESKDRGHRRVLLVLAVMVAFFMILAGVAGWIAYNAVRDQAQSATELAQKVREACDDPDIVMPVEDYNTICKDAEDVVEEAPASIDEPEEQEPEIQEPEIQENEIQESEIPDPESQEQERQEQERQDAENQEAEQQEDEQQDAEVQEGESQEPEIQDEEIQDPDPNDPDPVDDPDPNNPFVFDVADNCDQQAGMVVVDVALRWERTGNTWTLVLNCTQREDQTNNGGGSLP